MKRCSIIDKLEDEYGIKPENLTEREKAIIGLCTNEFLENEENALSIAKAVGRSEQCCSPTEGFYLGMTCPTCNKPFRMVHAK